jgi:hypothetical protein
MPSVVVLNYGYETELPIGSGAGPWTQIGGDVTRVYEGIPVPGLPWPCTGSLFGTVSVRQEGHGYDRAEINGAYVYVDDVEEAMTGSTGGYQITDVLEGERTMVFTKTGFFDGEATPVVECGKETLQDVELVCSNPLTATVVASDTLASPIPGATVTVTSKYQYTFDTTEYKVVTDETDNAGTVTFDVAAGDTITATASATGFDPGDCEDVVGDDGEDICYDNYTVTCKLCQWNTVVGTVKIGGEAAAGYRLDLVDMSVDPVEVVNTDTTTAAGVFSLEDLSKKAGKYRINLYNTGGTFISTTGDFTVDTCGETAQMCYDSGQWTNCPQ